MKGFVLSYLIAVPLALLTGCASSSAPSVNHTCYVNDPVSKQLADAKVAETKEIMRTRPKSGASSEEIKAWYPKFNRRQQLEREAALLGHPGMIQMHCWRGKDFLAPGELREEGLAWCRVGAEMVPELRAELETDLEDRIKKIGDRGRKGIAKYEQEIRAKVCVSKLR